MAVTRSRLGGVLDVYIRRSAGRQVVELSSWRVGIVSSCGAC